MIPATEAHLLEEVTFLRAEIVTLSAKLVTCISERDALLARAERAEAQLAECAS